MKYLSNLSDIPEFSSAATDLGQFFIPRPIIDNPQFNDLKSSGIFTLHAFIKSFKSCS